MNETMYEIRRGTLCEMAARSEICERAATAWLSEHACETERLYTSQMRFLLVMKELPDNMILVTSVYDRHVRNTRKISINNQHYWAKYDEFSIIPGAAVYVAAGKKLDRRMAAISGIYEAHERVKKRDWRIELRCREEAEGYRKAVSSD